MQWIYSVAYSEIDVTGRSFDDISAVWQGLGATTQDEMLTDDIRRVYRQFEHGIRAKYGQAIADRPVLELYVTGPCF
jgi:hypothetical protein